MKVKHLFLYLADKAGHEWFSYINLGSLIVCVDLVKHLMHGIYILKPKVDKVAENTPKPDGA